MELYYISDRYTDYLHKHDTRVELNKHGTRPYIGIIFNVGDYNYFAPLTSPKPKHKKMSNSVDFRKIAGGKYGAINLSSMIPVVLSEATQIKLSDIEDDKYRILLTKQFSYIRDDQDNIKATAARLHFILLKNETECSSFELRVRQRSCNLAILEEASIKFKPE